MVHPSRGLLGAVTEVTGTAPGVEPYAGESLNFGRFRGTRRPDVEEDIGPRLVQRHVVRCIQRPEANAYALF